MISSVFYFLLNMSITATAIGLVISLLRAVKPLPRKVIYPLWGLVLLRLVLPFTFSSEASLLNSVGSLFVKAVPVGAPVQVPIIKNFHYSALNSVQFAESYFSKIKPPTGSLTAVLPEVTYKTQDLTNIFATASTVWIVGVCIAFAVVTILYILSTFEMRKSKHYRDNIYTSETALSPLVYGVFRHRIIIPKTLLDRKYDLKNILLHENIHIQRHDNFIRFIAILVACLHWFNPFVWLFLRSFLVDMEITCDSKAVSKLSKPRRKRYAETLLTFGVERKMLLTSGFGRSNVKVRVLNVLNYEKLTWLAAIFSVLFIVTIAVLLATNPIQ